MALRDLASKRSSGLSSLLTKVSMKTINYLKRNKNVVYITGCKWLRPCTTVETQMHILCAEKYGNMQLQFAYISLLVVLRLLVYFRLSFFLFLLSSSLFLSTSVASLLSESGNSGFNLQTPHCFFFSAPVKRADFKGKFYL